MYMWNIASVWNMMNEGVSMFRSQAYEWWLCERSAHMHSLTHTSNEWMKLMIIMGDFVKYTFFVTRHEVSWPSLLFL